MEEPVRPRPSMPSQDEQGRRCVAMYDAFIELYSRLRKELGIEVTDLNSALFSKWLISASVLDKKNIETTLTAIMKALKNESVAEKTFEGFINVLSEDISSKEHLAQALLKNFEDKLKRQQAANFYVAPNPVTCTRQEGSTVVVNGSSYSTSDAGQLGGTVPSKSRTECGISSQKMRPELATTTLEDSGLSDGEDFTTTPQQPTGIESTDHNYGVAPEASGTLPLEPHVLPNQLQEIIKRNEQEKRINEVMIDRRDEEIKMLRSLRQQYNDKCDELQLQLLSKKQEAADQKELAEKTEEKAKMAEKKAEELAKELEETKDEMLQYKQEADDQKELIEAAEEKAEELAKEHGETKEEMLKYKQEAANQKELAELAEEKADKLAKELEETKDEMLKCKQEAADQKKLAELAEEKAEELKELDEKTQEQAKKHEEPEEETRQYKQEAAEHKKMAEQKKEFAFCTELAKHEKEVAKLSSNTTENFSSDKATGSSILSINELVMVKRFLKYFNDWQSLGLELGLLYPILERIDKEQHGDVNKCTMKMLAAWLQQQDNVSQVGVPSWSVLQTALKNIGENELANTMHHHQY